MEFIASRVLRELWDVDRRLSELKLDRKRLLSVRDVAMNASANATPFHPANAAGTFAYQDGSWALRDQFAGNEWAMDRDGGVEAIKCDALKVRVAFCNVDRACDDNQMPKPRSRKGAGAERASGTDLFGDLPQFAAKPTGEWALYYLMVDERRAAELTRPVVRGGTFVSPIERLYLSDGNDGDGDLLLRDPNDIVNDFDPFVARKK
jgi:hypothetical protein